MTCVKIIGWHGTSLECVHYGGESLPSNFPLRSWDRSSVKWTGRLLVDRFTRADFPIETPRRRTVNNNFTPGFAPNARHVGYSLAVRVKSVHAISLRVGEFRHESQDKNPTAFVSIDSAIFFVTYANDLTPGERKRTRPGFLVSNNNEDQIWKYRCDATRGDFIGMDRK